MPTRNNVMNVHNFIPATNHALCTQELRCVQTSGDVIVCPAEVWVFVARHILCLLRWQRTSKPSSISTSLTAILCFPKSVRLHIEDYATVLARDFCPLRPPEFRGFLNRSGLRLIGARPGAKVVGQQPLGRFTIEGSAALGADHLRQRTTLLTRSAGARAKDLLRFVPPCCTWETFKRLAAGSACVGLHSF